MRFVAIFLLFSALSAAAGSASLGLVLSGGGAKGAYEVGVWQELEAAGLAPRVKVISGTSVGAINAALFATRPAAAETLWLEHVGDMFTFNTNRLGQSIQKTLDTVSNSVEIAKETGEDWKGYGHFILSSALRIAENIIEATQSDNVREGYLNSSPLASALNASLPADWPTDAPVVYATAREKGRTQAKTWRLNDKPREQRMEMILASAAIPFGFTTVRLDGTSYDDGGWESQGGDNVPLDPILENHPEIKTVIIVYLDVADDRTTKKRIDRNKAAAERAAVELIEITPSRRIGGLFGWGGVFDASPDTAKRLMELGRKDAEKVLREKGLIQ